MHSLLLILLITAVVLCSQHNSPSPLFPKIKAMAEHYRKFPFWGYPVKLCETPSEASKELPLCLIFETDDAEFGTLKENLAKILGPLKSGSPGIAFKEHFSRELDSYVLKSPSAALNEGYLAVMKHHLIEKGPKHAEQVISLGRAGSQGLPMETFTDFLRKNEDLLMFRAGALIAKSIAELSAFLDLFPSFEDPETFLLDYSVSERYLEATVYLVQRYKYTGRKAFDKLVVQAASSGNIKLIQSLLGDCPFFNVYAALKDSGEAATNTILESLATVADIESILFKSAFEAGQFSTCLMLLAKGNYEDAFVAKYLGLVQFGVSFKIEPKNSLLVGGVMANRPELVKSLLQLGDLIKFEEFHASFGLACDKKPEILALFLDDIRAQPGFTLGKEGEKSPLELACRWSDHDTVGLFLAHPGMKEVDMDYALELSINNKDEHIVRLLISDGNIKAVSVRCFSMAIARDSPLLLSILLDHHNMGLLNGDHSIPVTMDAMEDQDVAWGSSNPEIWNIFLEKTSKDVLLPCFDRTLQRLIDAHYDASLSKKHKFYRTIRLIAQASSSWQTSETLARCLMNASGDVVELLLPHPSWNPSVDGWMLLRGCSTFMWRNADRIRQLLKHTVLPADFFVRKIEMLLKDIKLSRETIGVLLMDPRCHLWIFDPDIMKAFSKTFPDNLLARGLMFNPSFIRFAGEDLLEYNAECFLACPQATKFFEGSAASGSSAYRVAKAAREGALDIAAVNEDPNARVRLTGLASMTFASHGYWTEFIELLKASESLIGLHDAIDYALFYARNDPEMVESILNALVVKDFEVEGIAQLNYFKLASAARKMELKFRPYIAQLYRLAANCLLLCDSKGVQAMEPLLKALLETYPRPDVPQ